MADELDRGRESYRHRAWGEAYAFLARVDRSTPLETGDLDLLATSAYLVGRNAEFERILDRAYHAHLKAGDQVRAARCAFWLGFMLLLRGETGHGTGWLARARRLLEGQDCVEQGYLLLPAAEQHLADDHGEAAYAAAARAAETGDRFADADLTACARHMQGRALIQQGQVRPGLALLDEAMVAVVDGELSPIVSGLIYCSVIEACQQVYASSRARQWTSALARWCDQQPEMVAFTGACLVHRAEIMQLRGAWPDAMAEAFRACERSSAAVEARPPGAAFYRQAEIYRLRGEFASAEEAYRNASGAGVEPQPGLALLRLAQGRTDAAYAAIRRVTSARTDRLERAKLLPAHVEIALAAGDLPGARSACGELSEIAARFDPDADVLAAIAAHARGAVALAQGDAHTALGALRRAFEGWRVAEAPYEAARTRVLMGQACRALGDEEGAALDLGAARAEFERLGAAPDVERVDRIDSLARMGAPGRAHGLTSREMQVLRLLAAGKTNKAIALELSLSERTIDRHASNIFRKLDVSSRAAATAHAYEHKLL